MYYNREQLEEYVDLAVKKSNIGGMITELIGELNQIAINMEANEDGDILTEDLPKYLDSGDIFTENPNYFDAKCDYQVFDNEGKLFLKVEDIGYIKAKYNGRTFQISNEIDEDTRELFLDLCEVIQKKDNIKYPNVEED